MTGHNAENIVGQVDWEEWPDFELFSESDDESEPPDEEAAA
jgi:hypothetical protein